MFLKLFFKIPTKYALLSEEWSLPHLHFSWILKKKVLNYIVCHESFSILPNTKYFKGYKCAYIFIRWTCVYTMVYDLRLCHFEVVMIMWKVFRMHAYICLISVKKLWTSTAHENIFVCSVIFMIQNIRKFGKVGKFCFT